MLRFGPCLLALFLLMPKAGGQQSAPNAPETARSSVSITRDIAYTTDSTGTYRGDLYQATGPGPHPALVLIHGGSWRSGRKSELRRLGRDLAAQGFTCFSIDYDTRPHSFPHSWQESRAAVAFLRTHAAVYHISPEHLGVLGTSAGGQLAALLALAPAGPKGADASLTAQPAAAAEPASAEGAPPPPPPGVLEPVQAAVLFNGGYDLHPRHWLLRRYLGGDCTEIPEVCDDASPDFHVAAGAPPIFVGHGTHDHLIPYSQATTFVGLLEKAHDPVTPYVADGAGHSYWRSHHWYGPNLTSAVAFLGEHLRPS